MEQTGAVDDGVNLLFCPSLSVVQSKEWVYTAIQYSASFCNVGPTTKTFGIPFNQYIFTTFGKLVQL
jgi:hypothetical protein